MKELKKELELINWINTRAGKPGKGVKLGIGDDCAALQLDKKRYLLWAADMIIENTHFVLGEAPYEKIGRKAVAVNISDIAAMGGVPRHIVASIGVPPKLEKKDIFKIYNGIFKICRQYDIKLIGGDTNFSERLIIDTSIFGVVEKSRMVKRSGAGPGDIIFVTGPVRDGKKEHLTFRPRLEEARYLTKHYKVSAMIDTSDGIGTDLGRVASASGVRFTLDKAAIPLSKGLSLKDALYYGESFELLFTLDKTSAKRLLNDKAAKRQKFSFYPIGRVTAWKP